MEATDQALAQARIAPELGPDETCLWVGGPRRGFVLRPSDVFLIPFSAMWGGFAIVWEVSVWRLVPLPGGWGFRLWGVPFVLVGLHLMVGRFFYDAWARGRTAYAVTTQRVLIVVAGRSRSITSLRLETLSDVILQEKRDGTGTIVLGPTSVGRRRPASPRLEFIAQARGVHDTIRRARARG